MKSGFPCLKHTQIAHKLTAGFWREHHAIFQPPVKCRGPIGDRPQQLVSHKVQSRALIAVPCFDGLGQFEPVLSDQQPRLYIDYVDSRLGVL